jgi:hypothetical protein
MPLTEFQARILSELAKIRTDDRYLAGGAALHFGPNTTRFSNDLDFFHDSVERVASTFSSDGEALRRAGLDVSIETSLPGFIRAVVTSQSQETRVDWAHDSAWRFMPLVRDTSGVLMLHPVDLSVNKVLALAGRDEPRDFIDILFIHSTILSLAALCWAAAGKDPGFSPLSLLELLKRRGHYRAEDFARLHLTAPVDLVALKSSWLSALGSADEFARTRPADELGCLYYSLRDKKFVTPPAAGSIADNDIVPHFGRPGGVVPRVVES